MSALNNTNSINNVEFSDRELDVLACVFQKNSSKTIAKILNISDRTVASHIRNIMVKLSAHDRNGIKAYISNNSDKYNFNAHYQNLLKRRVFTTELKQIAKKHIIKANCTIFYFRKHREKDNLLIEIAELLTTCGLIVNIKIWEKDKTRIALSNNFNFKDHYIIYAISKEFIEYLQDTQYNLGVEFQNISALLKEHSKQLVILELGQHLAPKLFNVPAETKSMQLSGNANIYLFTLNLLSFLIPDINVDHTIAELERETSQISKSDDVVLPAKEKTINADTIKFSLKDVVHSKFKRTLIIIGTVVLMVGIGLYFGKTKITNFKNHTQTSCTVNDQITWNIPRQDHVFIGRKHLLQDLHSKLHKKQDVKFGNTLAIIACAGLGGLGKTTLALQYINHAEHPYSLKAWFYAEKIDDLQKQYLEFAKRLGFVDATLSTAISQVNGWLATHPGWLLVYDNVNNYEEISAFLPKNDGHVILTSRQRDWPENFDVLEIDVMTEKEAIQTIATLSHRNINVELSEGKDLVKVLGYLPLALAQAGAYIYQNNISIAEYLELYKKYEILLLKDQTLPTGVKSNSVAITWNISLAAIAKVGKNNDDGLLAKEILTVCAYLAPEKISRQILFAWIKERYPNHTALELLLNKHISKLWQYSMVNVDENNCLTVHRLVQAVLRHQHNNPNSAEDIKLPVINAQWLQILLQAMHKEFNRTTTVLEDEKRRELLLPHMQMLFEHYQTLKIDVSKQKVADLVNDIGVVLYSLGDPRIAKYYYEQALDLLEKSSGLEDIKLAPILDSIGQCCRHIGDLKLAKLSHQRALKIKEQYYGKNHFELSNTLANIGTACRELGDFKNAESFHARALDIAERHFGKNHVEIAFPLTQLGRIYRYFGKVQDAKACHERALKIKEKYYTSNHAEVADTLDQLASDYRELGDPNKARILHARALSIYEGQYGKNNFKISWVLDHLGKDYRNIGDLEKAKKIHTRCLKIKESHYNKDNIEIAWTLDQLGNDYRELGDPKTAKEMHQRALEIKENGFGEDNIEVSLTLDYLGNAYRELGDPKTAKETHKRGLEIKVKYFEDNHFEIMHTIILLSNDYRELGDMENFNKLHKQGLEIAKHYFGSGRKEVAWNLEQLANEAIKSGNTKVAKQFYSQVKKIKTTLPNQNLLND